MGRVCAGPSEAGEGSRLETEAGPKERGGANWARSEKKGRRSWSKKFEMGFPFLFKLKGMKTKGVWRRFKRRSEMNSKRGFKKGTK